MAWIYTIISGSKIPLYVLLSNPIYAVLRVSVESSQNKSRGRT